ncbi:tetratricopeptide repeat protein [Streptomyces lydicus]|uniref:tetratricopeptide repeat protein n=1 Tax=Streptomyces lydicus TaxID=47763 RepID=UPI003701806C
MSATASSVFDKKRLVEVWAGPAGGPWTLGTGTWLGPRLILTAGHVVVREDGTTPPRVRVRPVGQAFPTHGELRRAEVVWWGGAGLDAALLTVADDKDGRPDPWSPAAGLPLLRWGQLTGQGTGVDAQAAGFPNSVAVKGQNFREVEQTSGTINALAGFRSGRHLMTTEVTPAGTGAWGGMSGAAVTCGELLCGIVVERTPYFHSSRLTVLPVSALLPTRAADATDAADDGATGVFRQLIREDTGRETFLESVELQGVLSPWYRAAPPASPAALLLPEFETVPFRPRAELARLHAWCKDGRRLSGLLMTGPGGQGKSRLARTLAAETAARGWVSGRLADGAPDRHLDALARTDAPLLLVIDYAEARAAVVERLVAHLAAHPSGHPVRLLMLGRTDGEWWADLCRATAASACMIAEPVRLSRLEEHTDAVSAYRSAAHALAAALGRVEGWTGVDWTAVDLPDPEPGALGGGHALSVHMAALAALLSRGLPAGDVPASEVPADGKVPAEPDGPEEVILAHEETYWNRIAAGRRLAFASLRRGVVSAALLAGAATREQALAVLALLPGLRGDVAEDGRRQLAGWVRDLYPADGAGAYWGSLHPDRLTERCLATFLAREDEARFLDDLLPGLDEQQAVHALTLLTRVLALPATPSSPPVDLAGKVRDLVVSHAEALAVAAVTVVPRAQHPEPLLAALRRICEDPDLPIGLSHRLHDAVPQQTQRLAWHAAELVVRQAAHYGARVPSAGPWRRRRSGSAEELHQLGRSLNAVAVRLRDLGRTHEALEASEKAVVLYRGLARTDPGAHLHHLAMCLHTLSIGLGATERPREALSAIEEAVRIRRGLLSSRPEFHQPYLARELNILSNMREGVGKEDEALQASEEAVRIYRSLDPAALEAHLPLWGSSLHNLAVRWSHRGQGEKALKASAEAVSLRRRLAADRPDAHLADLAASLANHAGFLTEAGRTVEALPVAAEAADILRPLAGARSEVNGSALVDVLLGQIERLGDLGRVEDALAAAEDVVRTCREPTEARPDPCRSDLALGLHYLGCCLRAAGRGAEAVQTEEECRQLLRELSALHALRGSPLDPRVKDLAEAVGLLTGRGAGPGPRWRFRFSFRWSRS